MSHTKRILSIIELEDTSIDYLKAEKFYTVRKLAMTYMDNFYKISYDNTIGFNIANADHIYFFQKCFTSWYLKADITDME